MKTFSQFLIEAEDRFISSNQEFWLSSNGELVRELPKIKNNHAFLRDVYGHGWIFVKRIGDTLSLSSHPNAKQNVILKNMALRNGLEIVISQGAA